MKREPPICQDCKQRECELFEDSEGTYYDERCEYCNDKLIARARNAAEWRAAHCEE